MQFLGRVRAHTPVIVTKTRAAFVAGAFTAMPVLTGDDFFEHKFITDKNPDDIIDCAPLPRQWRLSAGGNRRCGC